MSDDNPLVTTQDDRVMAGLAHISALLPLMGVIVPIVIWVTQKEKSKYVAFQALQALAYQLTMILAWFIGMACYMLSFFSIFVTSFIGSAASDSPALYPFLGFSVLIPFMVFGAIFIGGFAFVVYGAVGGVLAFLGKPFRYIVIGKRVERFMQPKQTEPVTAAPEGQS
jgi:uncharacterized Tic20 family protein